MTNSRPNLPLFTLAIVPLIGTILWVVLMIAGGPAPHTFEQALFKVSGLGPLYYLTYLNAALLTTVPTTMLMAALYGYCKPSLSGWVGHVAVAFVPVYCVLNLFVYLSQITVIPALLAMRVQVENRPTADLILRLTLQELPDSTVAFFNVLAYAILAIPSIVFGKALAGRSERALRAGGALLALSGGACLIGLAGTISRVESLRAGVVVGGCLFLLALVFCSVGFWLRVERSKP
jgi:hypothetical protein